MSVREDEHGRRFKSEFLKFNLNLYFSVVVIGESMCGKTNLLTRFTSNKFELGTPSTVGVVFSSKSIAVCFKDLQMISISD